MGEESDKRTGRPKSPGPRYTIDMTAVDSVTSRMIDALVVYGRFGSSRPEVALYIIRSWLMEKEDYLRRAIDMRDAPLGRIYPEQDTE